MTDKEYRAFLDLIMCSDPWPVKRLLSPDSTYQVCDEDNGKLVIEFADKEAQKRGYENWVVAYHEIVREGEEPV